VFSSDAVLNISASLAYGSATYAGILLCIAEVSVARRFALLIVILNRREKLT
jgi:hypothetical protein